MSCTLGIIPARGGSRGIPGKNIRDLGGLPLIAHTLRAAREAARLDHFLVSTDNPDIARIAEAHGSGPVLARPPELATDASPTIAAVVHAVTAWEAASHRRADIVVVLQPTSPLRTGADIDAALGLLAADTTAASVISGYDASHVHPAIMHVPAAKPGRVLPFLEDANGTRRQDFPRIFVRNGAIYAALRALVMERHRLHDEMPLLYEMPRQRSVNIDEPADLELAAYYLQQRSGR